MATSSNFRFVWRGTQIAVQLEAAIEAAMEDTAQTAQERAVELCPVGPDHKDGSTHLYEEISATVERGPSSVTMTLKADKDYAVHVIFGTSRMAAQDFIRPAIDAEAPKLAGRIRARVARIR